MMHGTKSERNKRIITRVLEGETLQAVGNAYKLTGERIRQIVYRAMWRMFKDNNYAGASTWQEIKATRLSAWRASRYFIINRL